jgi:Uma2 family endonuclease
MSIDLTMNHVLDRRERNDMSAALKWNLVSVQDYLANELASPTKHEYVGGVVYAMAGARIQHNRIATNIVLAIGPRLEGKSCEVFNSDQKIRIKMKNHVRFYYPEVSVICRSNPDDEQFQDEPATVFEVLSRSTRRADLGEKKDGYLAVPSLKHYVLVEQDVPVVVVFRRKGRKFVREVYEGLDAVVPLPEIGVDLPLAEIYKRVEFTPESDDEGGETR